MKRVCQQLNSKDFLGVRLINQRFCFWCAGCGNVNKARVEQAGHELRGRGDQLTVSYIEKDEFSGSNTGVQTSFSFKNREIRILDILSVKKIVKLK